MIVEDELAIARAYARVLAAAGFEVASAGDGAAARQRLESETFDAVVTDVWMPGKDGFDVLLAARATDLDVSVILVTGAPSDEAAETAVARGALLYLVKPLDLRALVQVVTNAVRITRIARLKRAAAPAEKQLGDLAGLEVNFRRSLSEVWMAYQPIVQRPGGAVFAYEALLRSRNEMLPNPGALLQAAERLGQLHVLGRAVRGHVAAVMGSLAEGTTMFVNLHPQDLADEELRSPHSPLAQFASRVVLEITERATLADVGDLATNIAALRALGYRIALDDFGAGYAGLSTFVHLRPEVVKLDMAIVRDVDRDPVKAKLIGAMVSMCRDSKIAVVAEGVETAAERDTLIELGCELLQGYLFGKPGPAFPPVNV